MFCSYEVSMLRTEVPDFSLGQPFVWIDCQQFSRGFVQLSVLHVFSHDALTGDAKTECWIICKQLLSFTMFVLCYLWELDVLFNLGMCYFFYSVPFNW